jgi:hypothetical protein
MILRRIIAAFVLLWAFPCLAQTGSIKTPAQLNSEINTTFPNNTVGQITPAGVRQVALDQVASVPFLNVTNVFSAIQSFPNGVTINGGTITGAAWSGGTITGLPTPVNPSDAVTLSFVNAAVTTGINILAPSRLATAAILPNTPTYSNGTAGVGATLTSSTNSTLTVDGIVANLNDIILVKNQASAFQNGIYTLTTAGSGSAAWVLTRVSYFDIVSQMKVGSYTFITAGTANANSAYTLQSTVVTVGTDALTWALFSSTGTAVTSLDATNGNISVQSGSLKVVSGQLSSNVLSSRTFAQTQNLANFNSIQTQGYATPGDHGGAAFKNVGSSPFTDSQIATGTISNNGVSGCTTVAAGVALTGGSGRGAAANVSVVGGVVTVVALVNNHGNAYAVGDVLSIAVAGCAQTPTFTVATLTIPTASFTDAVGTHFQFIVDAGNYANVRQFGAACNWTLTAGDAGSTNDTTAIQNGLNWAGDTVQPTVDGGGVAGETLLVPPKNCLSDAIFVPFGVTFSGHNAWSSQIKFTDAMGAAVIPVTICEPTTHLACFGSRVMNMTLKGGSGTANTNVPMVFSNSLQQMNMLWRVAFYPNQRGCVQYDSGFGGAAQVGFTEVECTMSSTGNPGFNLTNLGTTLVYFKNVNTEAGGSGVTASGINVGNGGFIDIDNFHTEGVSTGIFLNNTGSTSTGAVRLHNLSGGAHCTNLVLKQSGSVAGDLVVGMATPNGCTNTVSNGGTNTTIPIIADTLF